jgi:hypothetical protein
MSNNFKCLTFDLEAQHNLPQSIKDKMKADRERARKQEQERLEKKATTCPYCGHQHPLVAQFGACGKCASLLY